jgi:F0F1-type ATP synthase membrane subunit b/b'
MKEQIMTRESTAEATNEIERIYNKAVAELERVVATAIVGAQSYTRPSVVVESQQAYIDRLKQLRTMLEQNARISPLRVNTINFDWV